MDSEKLATFSTVTGADETTAQHVLESFNGDMDRAVNFFMENGEDGMATLRSFAPAPAAAQPARPAEVMPLSDDEEPLMQNQNNGQRQAAAPSGDRGNRSWQEEERALQEALEASKMTAGSNAATGAGSTSQHLSSSVKEESDSDIEEYEPSLDSDMEMDTEEDYMRKLAATQRPRRGAASPPLGMGATANGIFGGIGDENDGPRIRRNRPSGAMAGAAQHMDNLTALSRRLGIPAAAAGRPPTLPGGLPAAFDDGAGPSGLPGAAFAGRDSDLPDMPAGVDVEEARMLEAAMLGIPYEGRIPDFAAAAGAAAGFAGGGGAAFGDGGGVGDGQPVSPGTRQNRILWNEQDWAYQASLAADQEKARKEEELRLAAEAEAKRVREEAEAAAKAQREDEEELAAQLSAKQEALPPEPPATDANVLTVLIKLPSGRRLTRRFRKSDKLQSLYDFVDLSEPGDDLRPGTYVLVTNMPRKVYEETTANTLAEAGLVMKQEMLLLEPKG